MFNNEKKFFALKFSLPLFLIFFTISEPGCSYKLCFCSYKKDFVIGREAWRKVMWKLGRRVHVDFVRSISDRGEGGRKRKVWNDGRCFIRALEEVLRNLKTRPSVEWF